jgi:hypothetical protein
MSDMRYTLITALAACLTVPAAIASATVVLPVDFAEMVAESQLIVHGRVVDVRPQPTAGRRTIESVVTVEVVTTLKGEPRTAVVLKLPGGRVGRYRRVMVGVAELAEGDELVLFLKGRAPALPMPFGLNQGVYRVSRDNDRALVMPPIADTPGRVVRGDPARRPLALDVFERQVRTMVQP